MASFPLYFRRHEKEACLQQDDESTWSWESTSFLYSMMERASSLASTSMEVIQSKILMKRLLHGDGGKTNVPTTYDHSLHIIIIIIIMLGGIHTYIAFNNLGPTKVLDMAKFATLAAFYFPFSLFLRVCFLILLFLFLILLFLLISAFLSIFVKIDASSFL